MAESDPSAQPLELQQHNDPVMPPEAQPPSTTPTDSAPSEPDWIVRSGAWMRVVDLASGEWFIAPLQILSPQYGSARVNNVRFNLRIHRLDQFNWLISGKAIEAISLSKAAAEAPPRPVLPPSGRGRKGLGPAPLRGVLARALPMQGTLTPLSVRFMIQAVADYILPFEDLEVVPPDLEGRKILLGNAVERQRLRQILLGEIDYIHELGD